MASRIVAGSLAFSIVTFAVWTGTLAQVGAPNVLRDHFCINDGTQPGCPGFLDCEDDDDTVCSAPKPYGRCQEGYIGATCTNTGSSCGVIVDCLTGAPILGGLACLGSGSCS